MFKIDGGMKGLVAAVVAGLAVMAFGNINVLLACLVAIAAILFAGESYFRFSTLQLNYIETNWDDYQNKGDLEKILKGNKYYRAGKEYYLDRLATGIRANRHIGWFLAFAFGAVCWFWGEVLLLALAAGISAYLIVKFASGDPTIDLSAEGNLW